MIFSREVYTIRPYLFTSSRLIFYSGPFPWKMGDADLVGYPVIVVVGRRWEKEMVCEVQCRRLQVRQDIAVGDLPSFIRSLLSQL